MKLVLKKLSDLKPLADNAKIHDANQIQDIRKSFDRWGYIPTILTRSDNTIVGGHGTWTAAKEHFGEDQKLQVIEIPNLKNDAETEALALALNQLQLKTGFDSEKVSKTLEKLRALKFPLEIIGFSLPELQTYLPDLRPMTSPEEREKEDRREYVGIKQIMLHYQGDEFLEFSEKCRLLAAQLKLSSVSEVVFLALKHFYEAQNPQNTKAPTKRQSPSAQASA